MSSRQTLLGPGERKLRRQPSKHKSSSLCKRVWAGEGPYPRLTLGPRSGPGGVGYHPGTDVSHAGLSAPKSSVPKPGSTPRPLAPHSQLIIFLPALRTLLALLPPRPSAQTSRLSVRGLPHLCLLRPHPIHRSPSCHVYFLDSRESVPAFH